ncbi:MAG: hypothetical protein SWH78_00075 [Thermodesulfobacteriota bacterium]|nr:hypothetical protein [Thermodesulfobacteriota bacterium]
MLMCSVRIEIGVQAESLDYVEERTAKLEDVIASHFDEDELIEFDFQIVEQTREYEIEEQYED